MRVVIFLLLVVLAGSAGAHQMSTAYLTAKLDESGALDGQWQVRLYDLELAVGLDSNADGQLLWKEVIARQAAITHYLETNFSAARNGETCGVAFPQTNWQVDTHFNEPYLLMPMKGQCAVSGDILLNYGGFFEQDSQHKLLVNFANQSGVQNRVVSSNQTSLSLPAEAGSGWATVRDFLYQGIIHIWIGIDHILFLLTLLLTCVLTRKDGAWAARDNIRSIVITATWIVTAFTLAHSLTLTATALGWIVVPSRWVEVGIAATVVVTALNNVYPLILRIGWLTFGFGLLHGMGFAGVLGELGVPSDQKVLTVLAFNAGVEIGQLVIVFALLPLLILVRNHRWYTRYGLASGSAVIAVIATGWIFERI
jgi:hypothetical protein